MGAPTVEDMESIVAAIEAKGMSVVHVDKFAHHGRMITIAIDEGHPDNVTILEIWPEGFMPDQIADNAAKAREEFGSGKVFEIGNNPLPY